MCLLPFSDLIYRLIYGLTYRLIYRLAHYLSKPRPMHAPLRPLEIYCVDKRVGHG